jgi:Sigma-70 region 2
MKGRTTARNETGTDEAALIRKIVDGPEVEDIVQQTALKAFTHLSQFRFEAGFRTWLIQIGLNEGPAVAAKMCLFADREVGSFTAL